METLCNVLCCCCCCCLIPGTGSTNAPPVRTLRRQSTYIDWCITNTNIPTRMPPFQCYRVLKQATYTALGFVSHHGVLYSDFCPLGPCAPGSLCGIGAHHVPGHGDGGQAKRAKSPPEVSGVFTVLLCTVLRNNRKGSIFLLLLLRAISYV